MGIMGFAVISQVVCIDIELMKFFNKYFYSLIGFLCECGVNIKY